MKLIVGLGNPGPKYVGHRHNIGFMVLDELIRRAGGSFTSRFKGEFARVQLAGQTVNLLKPMTFMNLSGESVGPCAAYYGVEEAECLVIHDELDIPYGTLKIKIGGGHGGHNGLKSIFQHFGKDFPRLRFGIGRPPEGETPVTHVLTDFNAEEQTEIDELLDRSALAALSAIRHGVQHAMNDTNRRRRPRQDSVDQDNGLEEEKG